MGFRKTLILKEQEFVDTKVRLSQWQDYNETDKNFQNKGYESHGATFTNKSEGTHENFDQLPVAE
mgnify:CR=1 FL=1